MNASFNPQLDSRRQNETIAFPQSDLSGISPVARAGVVNRTHRVVRQRASALQAQRSRVRSLMLPLIVCSSLLMLTGLAVWTGLYQYEAGEAAEAVQADVSALAAIDANNHFMVVLLWFVPVSLAVLAAVWYRPVSYTHLTKMRTACSFPQSSKPGGCRSRNSRRPASRYWQLTFPIRMRPSETMPRQLFSLRAVTYSWLQ